MTAARRLALAGGDSGPPTDGALDRLLRDLVRATQASAAFIVDADGQIPALFSAKGGAEAVDMPHAQLTAEARSRLLRGEVTWIHERDVVAKMCGTIAIVLVIEPSEHVGQVDTRVVEAAARIADALLMINPDAESVTAEHLATLFRVFGHRPWQNHGRP